MKLNVLVIFTAFVYGSSFALAAPGTFDLDLEVREFYETEDLIVRGFEDYDELEARGGRVCTVHNELTTVNLVLDIG